MTGFYLALLLFSGEGNGTPLQYSCLENPMDGGAWWAAVHAVAESRTRLSDFTFTFHFHALEKEMATHSSVLAWRIPGTAEPGGLPSMRSHRVGHDWGDLAAAALLFSSVYFYFIFCLLSICHSLPWWLSSKASACNAETGIWLLSWEDPLDKEMATHSSIFAWEILWTEECGGLQSMGLERVKHNLATKQHLFVTIYLHLVYDFPFLPLTSSNSHSF